MRLTRNMPNFLKLVIKVENLFFLCEIGRKKFTLPTFSIKYKVIIYGKMEALFMVDKELIAEIKKQCKHCWKSLEKLFL